MQHDTFITNIAKHLNYAPDSANYDLYKEFLFLILCDGGDDSFAHLNPDTVAFELSKFVTLKHIEDYDNHLDILDTYLDIKPKVIKSLNL